MFIAPVKAIVPEDRSPENPWRDRLQAAVREQPIDPALPDKVRRSLDRHANRQRIFAKWKRMLSRAAELITFRRPD